MMELVLFFLSLLELYPDFLIVIGLSIVQISKLHLSNQFQPDF